VRYPWDETQYGATWGPLTIQRIYSDDKYGLLLRIVGAKPEDAIEIHISPKGRSLRAYGPARLLRSTDREGSD
jgi:hypothetical protein